MRRSLVIGLVFSTLLFAASAHADTVAISFVGAPTGIIGPYLGSVNGDISEIICDDYLAETYWDESWVANVSTLPDVSGTKFGGLPGALVGYEEVAYLASKLLDPANAGAASAIQFALWEVFAAPIPFNNLSLSDRAAAQVWLDNANTHVTDPGFNVGEFNQFRIYTAVAGSATCGGGPCPGNTPQEFVTYVPEPGSLQLLAIGLLMAVGYAWYRKSAAGVSQVQSV